jgi:nucleoside-diphosphate-sugar epimerase
VFETLKRIIGYQMDFYLEGIPRDSEQLHIWRADIEKIQKTLGWYPKYKLEDGLIKTVKWFKKNIYLYEGGR